MTIIEQVRFVTNQMVIGLLNASQSLEMSLSSGCNILPQFCWTSVAVFCQLFSVY